MKEKLLDILLLPGSFYEKVTAKKPSLYAGIVFVGALDIIFPIYFRYFEVFKGKSMTLMNFNLGVLIVFVLLLGFIDILFFSLPLFDFIKLLKKGEVITSSEGLTKFAKVYIMAHVITLPLNLIFTALIYNKTMNNISGFLMSIAIIYSYFLMPAWFVGIVSRGANVIFKVNPKYKALLFAVIFTWNYLLANYAFDYAIRNWVMYFLKG